MTQDEVDGAESKLLQKTNGSEPHSLWKFIVGRQTLLLAFLGGLSLSLTSFGFTYWLSLHNLKCPSWAIDCTVISLLSHPQWSLPQIQGIISLIHGLGLACFFFIITTLAEPTLWPLLSRKSYTLASVDVYLQGTRGSLPSLAEALFLVRDRLATVVILCLSVAAVLSQLDRVIIGQAYTLQNTTRTYQSVYSSGGGIGLSIPASNENGPLADPAINGFAFYTSWAKRLSTEPLPDLREFIVDRDNLSRLDGFSISALKAQKSISCSSRPLKISDNRITTIRVTAEGGNTSVLIRTDPRLSCWIESSRVLSPTTSFTTLMFAATQGSIEGGAATNSSGFNISSLQCDVTTELLQASYQSGTGGPRPTTLSNATIIHAPANNLTEVAKWLGGAATAFGVKIYGARPMFGVGLTHGGSGTADPALLPQVYTTAYAPDGDGWQLNDWPQAALRAFVNATAGAVALAMAKQMNGGPVVVHANARVPQLSSARAFLLLLPTGAMLAIVAALAVANGWSHRAARIERVRPARLLEWTQSASGLGMNQALQAHEDGALDTAAEANLENARYRLRRNGHKEWVLEIE